MAEERQIKIKDAYLQNIIDLGYDYDGYKDADSLKSLIDELVDLARKALSNDDKTPMYLNGGYKKLNILFEEIKNE